MVNRTYVSIPAEEGRGFRRHSLDAAAGRVAAGRNPVDTHQAADIALAAGCSRLAMGRYNHLRRSSLRLTSLMINPRKYEVLWGGRRKGRYPRNEGKKKRWKALTAALYLQVGSCGLRGTADPRAVLTSPPFTFLPAGAL